MTVYQIAQEYGKFPSEVLDLDPWDLSFNIMVTSEARKRIDLKRKGAQRNREARMNRQQAGRRRR